VTHTRNALVIGGGIAGPAVAMALQKAGIEATVYDAQAEATPRDGVFLTLASNGIDALRVLGADRPALDVGFATPTITLRSTTGKRRWRTAPRVRRSSDRTFTASCTKKRRAAASASSTTSASSRPRPCRTASWPRSPTAPRRPGMC
jgi:2-polyprenyl-6-methoxyphenol hydroxylase-like FAD-dependent oxidoreductase